MIEINQLSKSYDNISVLNDISLNIKKGEIYGLIGRSGAGKSTLLRCINKLETFEEGSLKINGIEMKDLKGEELRKSRKNIGMIFQHFSLMQRKTVYENIALPLEGWGYSRDVIEEKVKRLSEVVGVSDKLKSKPRELSGGQQQRVAIARALALDSNILLSDEATSALDPKTTESILDLLVKINQELNITMVIVSHEMDVIKKICDRVAILDKGNILTKGKVEDVFLRNNEVIKVFQENKYILPSNGVNIKVIAKEEDRDKKIISKMARELDISFSIPWSKTEVFKDSIFCVMVVNCDKNHTKIIKDFLDKNNIEWEVL